MEQRILLLLSMVWPIWASKEEEMKIDRCVTAARKAFELRYNISIQENAGLEPEPYIDKIFVSQKGSVVKVTIAYTLASLAGCFSDSMYHVIEPDTIRKAVYEFSGKSITLDGGPIFDTPWLEYTKDLQDEFFKEYADLCA